MTGKDFLKGKADMKRVIITTICMMVAAMYAADPVVSNVRAKQRYPWGLVDITCEVSGIEGPAKGLFFSVAAVLPDSGVTNKLTNFWVLKDGEKSSDFSVNANGNYWLLWDAKADLGEVRYTNMVVSVTVKNTIKNTMVQLWEGGPYWATKNIGAENPEDYGYYFWWGDTIGYKRENNKWVASDGSSTNYSFDWDTCPTVEKSNSTLQSEGWITAEGVLAPEHDAATVHWGGNWRMPTTSELDALNSNCTWVWTIINGVSGYVVSGKGDYASNSIFLPCAGCGGGTSLSLAGSDGLYWSSVPTSDSSGCGYAWFLYFRSSYRYAYYYYYRYLGRSVRPVQGFTK